MKITNESQSRSVRDQLIADLETSIETGAVGHACSRAIRAVIPESVVACSVRTVESEEIPSIVSIYAPAALGPTYRNAVRDRLCVLAGGLSPDPKSQLQVKRWRNGNLYLEFMEGAESEEDSRVMGESLEYPLVVQGSIWAIFHVSAPTEADLNRASAGEIFSLAAETVERLRALVSSEHSRFEDLIESMRDGILLFDRNRNVVAANPPLLRLAEASSDEMMLIDYIKPLTEALPVSEAHIDLVASVYDVLLLGKTLMLPEISLHGKFYEMVLAPVRDHDEKISGGALILHDISHFKAIDRMKTEFVSVASHQLRTPLAAINWYVEMLLSEDAGGITDKQKDFLTEVYSGSRRMVRLVNELLNVSRLETGRLRIEPVSTQIESFIESIIKETEPLAKEKRMTVEFSRPDKALPEIPIDPSLMRQVIHNLVVNAIRYTPEADPSSVLVSVAKEDTRYLITVRDEGVGIPPEAAKRIFEKFFRADNARGMVTDGTGLGLYISKLIVEASGGSIGFTSPTGTRRGSDGVERPCGSAFWVALPISGMPERKGEVGLVSEAG